MLNEISPGIERRRPAMGPRLRRRLLLGGGIAAAAMQMAGCGGETETSESETMDLDATHRRLPVEGRLPSLDGSSGWLNSPPLRTADFAGRVVLFDFCTFTCINWIRTLPWRRAWHEKYRHHGLTFVGVHTPEFEFEKDEGNVKRALAGFGVSYPVALDADYAIWNAFANNYWPALYFIDAEGRIRHHVFGEGEYARSERIIQHLLALSGRTDVPDGLVPVDPAGIELAADWNSLRSPETYLGYQRGRSFRSSGGILFDDVRHYDLPDRLGLNSWGIAGSWTIGSTAAALSAGAGSIAFRFHARDVHLVMGPEGPGAEFPFRVRLDWEAPGEHRGSDVDAFGNGVAVHQRMYHLARQVGPVRERQLEIAFDRPGVAAFAFTFG